MTFDLTRGELLLTAVVFAFIYSAGWLPKLARRLSKNTREGSDV